MVCIVFVLWLCAQSLRSAVTCVRYLLRFGVVDGTRITASDIHKVYISGGCACASDQKTFGAVSGARERLPLNLCANQPQHARVVRLLLKQIETYLMVPCFFARASPCRSECGLGWEMKKTRREKQNQDRRCTIAKEIREVFVNRAVRRLLRLL